jgi:TRAP-type C4-dicarboxylate transport system permease small subunit
MELEALVSSSTITLLGKHMMTSPFNWIYRLTGAVAVACLAGIAVIILADIGMRQFGGQLRGSDDLAGFALVGTALLGLGPTYRHGGHIRVTLLLDKLGGTNRRIAEIVALAVATLIIGWATWWIGRFVYDSWRFNEIGTGLIAIKLWIPQSLMLIGLAVLLLAVVEDLVRVLSGKQASYAFSASETDDVARYE